MLSHAAFKQFRRALLLLRGGGDEAGAERLGQDEHVAGLRGGVRQDAVGVDGAGDREAELDLGVANGVAADDGAAGRGAALRAAGDDLAEPVEVELVVGVAREVERGDRHAAHGVDVAERVGGRDLAVDERVVHDRREKVDRLHDGEVRREPVNARVVVRLGADQQVRVPGLR